MGGVYLELGVSDASPTWWWQQRCALGSHTWPCPTSISAWISVQIDRYMLTRDRRLLNIHWDTLLPIGWGHVEITQLHRECGHGRISQTARKRTCPDRPESVKLWSVKLSQFNAGVETARWALYLSDKVKLFKGRKAISYQASLLSSMKFIWVKKAKHTYKSILISFPLFFYFFCVWFWLPSRTKENSETMPPKDCRD